MHLKSVYAFEMHQIVNVTSYVRVKVMFEGYITRIQACHAKPAQAASPADSTRSNYKVFGIR